MESRTKERLTGALIIIAILVVLIPELFSGPHPTMDTAPAQAPQAAEVAPVVTYELPVANQPVPASQDQSALLPQVSATGAPALPPPVVVEEPPAPVPPVAEPSPTPAPAVVDKPVAGTRAVKPPVTSSPAASGKGIPAVKPAAAKPDNKAPVQGSHAWTVQVGSFAQRANALHLVQDLKAKGFASQVSDDAKAKLFRVKVGPVADRPAALVLQAKLVSIGYRATLSAP